MLLMPATFVATVNTAQTGAAPLGAIFLVVTVFLAVGVEMVEALTIVLAAILTRGLRSSLIGAGAAVITLAAIVAVLGPALVLVPIDALRLVVGTLLLAFGLQWLRKAILRAGGYKSLHDEEAIFRRELAAAAMANRPCALESTGTPSPSATKVCCWKAWRSCSSSSLSARPHRLADSRRLGWRCWVRLRR